MSRVDIAAMLAAAAAAVQALWAPSGGTKLEEAGDERGVKQGLPDIARHILGCHLTQESRIQKQVG